MNDELRTARYNLAVNHLKQTYGLDPEDVDLQPDSTVVDVDIFAEKYDLQPIKNIRFVNKDQYDKIKSFVNNFNNPKK